VAGHDGRDWRRRVFDTEVNDDDSTVVLSGGQYLGSGYLNPGDVPLGAGVEASLRAAREALLDLHRGPP
jgi:hypothetical protein